MVTGTFGDEPSGVSTVTLMVFLSPGLESAGGVEETTPVSGSIVYFQPSTVSISVIGSSFSSLPKEYVEPFGASWIWWSTGLLGPVDSTE